MKITGKIKLIRESNLISEKFVKREFVLIDNSGMYEQELLMEFVQDKASILDNYVEGERVEVDINILGRMWTNPKGEDKYFVTLQAWRIEKLDASKPNTEQSSPQDDDDLPF